MIIDSMKMKEACWSIYNNNVHFAKCIRNFLNTIHWKCAEKYFEEVYRRRAYEIWDCRELSESLDPYYFNLSPNTARFGLIYWLQQYIGEDILKCVDVEHGVMLGNLKEKIADASWITAILTLSKHRQEILRKKTGKKSIAIGPYLHYVPHYYDEEHRKTIKNSIGKTLVYFHTHSNRVFDSRVNMEKIINQLSGFKYEFDTIMICLFFEDVNSDCYKYYIDNNFLVVTAGHPNDIFFLPRLKSIIDLAECTAGQAYGTHIGYCIYLKKPHFILAEGETCEDNSCIHFSFPRNLEGEKELVRLTSDDKYLEDEMEILRCFITTVDECCFSEISKMQFECAEKFWGLSQTKTAKEIGCYLSDDISCSMNI